MRIQYTLPRMQTDTLGTEFGETGPKPFKSRLYRLTQTAPPNWRQILRLDQPAYTATMIGPPPRPGTLEVKDVASERRRWRSLLTQRSLEADDPTEQRMLGLLRTYQSLEDGVVARYLADAQG